MNPQLGLYLAAATSLLPERRNLVADHQVIHCLKIEREQIYQNPIAFTQVPHVPPAIMLCEVQF